MSRRSGFTLIEVMISVAILALAGTAALKLAIMAENTLAAVSDKEKLLDKVQEVQVGVLTGELADNQQEDENGFSWETKDCTQEMFGKDFGKLTLGQEKSADIGADLKWRELTVTDKKGKKMTVCIPSKENADAQQNAEESSTTQNTSSSASSGDKK